MNKCMVTQAAWSVLIVGTVIWMVGIICLLYRIHLDLEMIAMGHNYSYELMDMLLGNIEEFHANELNYNSN